MQTRRTRVRYISPAKVRPKTVRIKPKEIKRTALWAGAGAAILGGKDIIRPEKVNIGGKRTEETIISETISKSSENPKILDYFAAKEGKEIEDIALALSRRIRKEYQNYGEDPGDINISYEGSNIKVDVTEPPKNIELYEKIILCKQNAQARIAFLTEQGISKIEYYMARHGLQTYEEVIDHIGKHPPINPKQVGISGAEGAALGIGAAILYSVLARRYGPRFYRFWQAMKNHVKNLAPKRRKPMAMQAVRPGAEPRIGGNATNGGLTVQNGLPQERAENRLENDAGRRDRILRPVFNARPLVAGLRKLFQGPNAEFKISNSEKVRIIGEAIASQIDPADIDAQRAIIIAEIYKRPAETGLAKAASWVHLRKPKVRYDLRGDYPNSRLVAAFQSIGFQVMPKRSERHTIMKTDSNERMAVIPHHPTEKIDSILVRKILEQARVTSEEFERMRSHL